jgi:hypothetical protein
MLCWSIQKKGDRNLLEALQQSHMNLPETLAGWALAASLGRGDPC